MRATTAAPRTLAAAHKLERYCAISVTRAEAQTSVTTSSKPRRKVEIHGRRCPALQGLFDAIARSGSWAGPITNTEHWKLATLDLRECYFCCRCSRSRARLSVKPPYARVRACDWCVGRDRVRLLAKDTTLSWEQRSRSRLD